MTTFLLAITKKRYTIIYGMVFCLFLISSFTYPLAKNTDTAETYTITGKIIDTSGLPVPDVTITVGGIYVAKTNSSGIYTVTGLSQATYSIKPSLSLMGISFSPSDRMVTIPPSAIAQDFTVTYLNPTTNTIQGHIADSSAGIIVTAQNQSGGGGIYTTTTNSNGDYQFSNLPAASYLLTPSTAQLGVTFEPLNRSVSVPPSVSAQNFTQKALTPGTNTISGKVTDSSSAAVANITITATGGYSAITSSSGEYTIQNVPNGSITITPSTPLLGVTFSPTTRNVTLPPSASAQNFQLVPLTNCPDLIKNGSFETDGDWYLPITVFPGGYSNDLIKAAAAAFSTEQVNSGSRSLRVGITDSTKNVYSYSSGWQQVTLPSTLSSANLKFYIYPLSMNGVDGFDVQLMIILNNNKIEVQRPVHIQKDERKWVEYNFDMKKYATQTVWVYFGVVNNGIAANMAMYVDDVSLLACK